MSSLQHSKTVFHSHESWDHWDKKDPIFDKEDWWRGDHDHPRPYTAGQEAKLSRSLPRQNIKLDHFYNNVIRGLLADLNVDLIFTCQVTPQTPDRRDVWLEISVAMPRLAPSNDMMICTMYQGQLTSRWLIEIAGPCQFRDSFPRLYQPLPSLPPCST